MDTVVLGTESGAFLKILLLAAFTIFIPLSAGCYYYSRHVQRNSEIERYLKILKIKEADLFRQKHEFTSLMMAVVFVTVLTAIFWAITLFGEEHQMVQKPNYLFGAAFVYKVAPVDDAADKAVPGAEATSVEASVGTAAGRHVPTAVVAEYEPDPAVAKRGSSEISRDDLRKYQSGALLIFTMAFLGAYLWGIQNIARRYTMNDLIPSAYFNIGVRMIFACIIALIIYHLSQMGPEFIASIFLDENARTENRGGDTTHLLMPVIAFLIGFFPQRGLNWLTEKFSMFTQYKDPSVRELPLEMIEGITIYDRVRLQELGVESCYDLANIDYIPYLFKSPYSPRELINWILQAKLCVYFGEHVKALREHGIHTVWQLKDYDEEALKELVRVSSLTEDTLLKVKKEIEKDKEIERLIEAQLELSRYWEKAPEGV